MNPLEHLIQRNDERRRKQSQRFYRFRLRTLVLTVGLYCAFCAATYYLGADLLNPTNRQANLTIRPIPSTPVSIVLPPICALVALTLGVVTAWGIFRLGPRYGFVGLCIVLCLSLIALVLATSLHTAPFEETEAPRGSNDTDSCGGVAKLCFHHASLCVLWLVCINRLWRIPICERGRHAGFPQATPSLADQRQPEWPSSKAGQTPNQLHDVFRKPAGTKLPGIHINPTRERGKPHFPRSRVLKLRYARFPGKNSGLVYSGTSLREVNSRRGASCRLYGRKFKTSRVGC